MRRSACFCRSSAYPPTQPIATYVRMYLWNHICIMIYFLIDIQNITRHNLCKMTVSEKLTQIFFFRNNIIAGRVLWIYSMLLLNFPKKYTFLAKFKQKLNCIRLMWWTEQKCWQRWRDKRHRRSLRPPLRVIWWRVFINVVAKWPATGCGTAETGKKKRIWSDWNDH